MVRMTVRVICYRAYHDRGNRFVCTSKNTTIDVDEIITCGSRRCLDLHYFRIVDDDGDGKVIAICKKVIK